MSIIKTAVFPVAGMGTRFLPVTKAGPKEMLPIIDKPIIQYVVEEAITAGIKQLVFVTSNSKRAIEDYFDSNYELESRLEERGKYDVLAAVRNILPDDVSIVYVRQKAPLGLGDAVLCARHVIGDQPFAVLLPDDIIDPAESSCMQDMVKLYAQYHASILAVESVPPEETDKYGVVALKTIEGRANRIYGIVEKPKSTDAPSHLAVTGRYILSPKIFDLLGKTGKGVGGEIQLTDAIAALLQEEAVMAYEFPGRRFDCGSRLGMLQATVTFALRRPDLADRFRAYLQELIETGVPQ